MTAWRAHIASRNSRAWIALIGLAVWGTLAIQAAPPEIAPSTSQPAGTSAGNTSGALEDLSDVIGGLIRLRLTEVGLILDRNHWTIVAAKTTEQDVSKLSARGTGVIGHLAGVREISTESITDAAEDAAFARLRLASRQSGGSSSSSSSGSRLGFTAEGMNGELERNSGAVRIMLEDKRRPRRLEVVDDGRGMLRLVLLNTSNGSMLVLNQPAGGPFSFGMTGAAGTVVRQSQSAAAFFRENREVAEANLLPMLGRYGITIAGLSDELSEVSPANLRRETIEADNEQSPFGELADDIGRLACLTVTRQGLRLDRAHWGRQLRGYDLEQLRKSQQVGQNHIGEMHLSDNLSSWPKELGKQATDGMYAMRLLQMGALQKSRGGGGGSGYSSGGNQIKTEFSIWRMLDSNLSIDSRQAEIVLEEGRPPGRRLQLVDKNAGVMLWATGENGDLAVVLQAADGHFLLLQIDSKSLEMTREPSYAAFAAKHSQGAHLRLLQLLRDLGIKPPVDPHDPAIIDAVALRLTGASEQDLLDGRQLVEKLDGNVYSEREQATKTLTLRISRYQQAVDEALARGDLSLEAKGRLEKLREAAEDPERITQTIDGMGLCEDTNYLTSILGGLEGRSAQAAAKHLSELSAKGQGLQPTTDKELEGSPESRPDPGGQ